MCPPRRGQPEDGRGGTGGRTACQVPGQRRRGGAARSSNCSPATAQARLRCLLRVPQGAWCLLRLPQGASGCLLRVPPQGASSGCLLGVPRGASGRLGVPQGASRLALGGAAAPREEAGPLRVHSLPWVLELAATKAAGLTAFYHPGGGHCGLRGRTWAQHGHLVITPLAAPQLAPCASSARAWRL